MSFPMPLLAKRPPLPTFVDALNAPAKINWSGLTLQEVCTLLADVEVNGRNYNRKYIVPIYKAARRAGWTDIANEFLGRAERPYLAAVKKQLVVKRLTDLAAYSALYIAVVMGVMNLLGSKHSLNEYLVVGGTYFVGRVLIRVVFATHYTDDAN